MNERGECQPRDFENIVSGGPLQGTHAAGGVIGTACVYWLNYEIVESDIRINTNMRYNRSGATCTDAIRLGSLFSHEFGHLMGSGHVSEFLAPTLVMKPSLGRCERRGALGPGDYIGRETLYVPFTDWEWD